MDPTTSQTALAAAIDRYVAHQRALGRGYRTEVRVLAALERFIAAEGAADLESRLFDRWCQRQLGLSANVRRARQRIVRNFCLYRARSEPGGFVPDPFGFPKPQPYAAPFIFGAPEVARMLAAADRLAPTPTSPLRAQVMRLAIVLLYTAGLRRGELLRPTLADADARVGVLRIRDSKFHQSREVPLSPQARRELRAYLRVRLAPPLVSAPDSPLLINCSRGQRGYTGTGLHDGIQAILRQAGIRDSDGRLPRVHDFRHSFAVQALLRWYRHGADVQSKLPLLAMYMGHVSIVSTAYYLQWIPPLAQAASLRFAAGFGHLIDGDEL